MTATPRDLSRGITVKLPAKGGYTSVFLHASGDHLVVRHHGDYTIPLAFESAAWKRAITRALELIEKEEPTCG